MQRTVCCQIHCLQVLFKEEFIALKYDDLLLNREMAFNSLSITEDQAKQIETTTCDQVHYKLWFRYRAVCVTASKFKAAASTDQSQPSVTTKVLSLVLLLQDGDVNMKRQCTMLTLRRLLAITCTRLLETEDWLSTHSFRILEPPLMVLSNVIAAVVEW